VYGSISWHKLSPSGVTKKVELVSNEEIMYTLDAIPEIIKKTWVGVYV